jgi:hypothetical protein
MLTSVQPMRSSSSATMTTEYYPAARQDQAHARTDWATSRSAIGEGLTA